ncbi:MAG: tetratricopeptide repeat protein [Gammaproteobacteria bacterium]|jgi:tetratricopeptide (TPR) repeat protein
MAQKSFATVVTIAATLLMAVGHGSSAQPADPTIDRRIRDLENRTPDTRSVFGPQNELLYAGAEAIRFGRYEEGIRLTLLGLERKGNSDRNRAAGLSNLCAAFAATNDPDAAIRYCTESLEVSELNWQAWSNRSYAYWLKAMYEEAASDLERAMAINDQARQLSQIRGMLNEAGLRPRIVTEDRQ